MDYEYKIYRVLNFGVAIFNPGYKTFKELFELAKLIRKDKNFSKIRYQIVDLRGCKFDLKESMFRELLELVYKYCELDNLECVVYIVNSPIETAYLQIFCLELPNRKICSTMKGAYHLLNLPISYDKFKNLIAV